MSEENSHTIIAIISGVLLTISELMPFISSIESKGLVHFLVNAGNKLLKSKTPDSDSDSETEPLLPFHNKQKQKVEKKHSDSESEHSDDRNSNEKNSSNEELLSYLKSLHDLKTTEEYQLEFIKNYIKQNYQQHFYEMKNLHPCNQAILEAHGYQVQYEHIDEIYKIRW